MATAIAMMAGGAVLNATTFVGDSYLAKYLSSGSENSQQFEREWHDKELEKYQRDYSSWSEKRQKYLDWQEQNKNSNEIVSQALKNTNYALKLSNKTHPHISFNYQPPQFSDYYRSSKQQKMGEMAHVSGGMMALGYAASKWL